MTAESSTTTNQPTRSSRVGLLIVGTAGGFAAGEAVISNTAIVAVSQDLSMNAATQTLATSTFTLALAASIMAFGSAADRVGRRKGLLLGFLLIIIGGLLAASAQASWWFILGRAISGIGAGGCLATGFSLVTALVPDPKRVGWAVGIFTACTFVGATVLGGVGGAVDNVSWRLAFVVAPTFAAALLLLSLRRIPEGFGERDSPPDYLGLSVLAVAMVTGLYGLSQVGMRPNAVTTWVPIAVSLVAFVSFYFIEKAKEHPVFPASLFKNKVFLAAVIAAMLWNGAESAAMLQSSYLFQYIYKFSPFVTVLGQGPITIAAIVGSIVIGRQLTKGRSARTCMMFGAACLALGFFMFSFVGLETPYWLFGLAFAIVGVGMGSIATPASEIFVQESPPKYLGPVAASRAACGQLGYAVGLAVSTALLSSFVSANFHSTLVNANVPAASHENIISSAKAMLFKNHLATTPNAQEILAGARTEYAAGYASVMLAGVGIVIILAAAIFVLLRKKHQADDV